MARIMQKIVVFIEQAYEPSVTPLNTGNLFMNRFSIDEDAGVEILKIFYPKRSCILNRESKGLDLNYLLLQVDKFIMGVINSFLALSR